MRDEAAHARVDQAVPPAGLERHALALVIALAVFALSLLTDLRVLPGDPALGQDYNDFYVAALAQRDGLNPYDGAVLTAIEERAFGSSSFSNTVASPPAFFVAFRPLTYLSPRPGYLLWTAVSAGLYLWAIARFLRLAVSKPIRPAPLVWALALSPPVVISIFLGQLALLVAAAFIWAAVAMLGGHPWRAGFFLAATLVMPHVMAAPIALLCGLAWRQGGRQAALATVTWAIALSVVAVPLAETGSMAHWLHALQTYGNTFDHWQPDLSSLAGVYLPFVPRPVGRMLSLISLLVGMLVVATLIARGSRLGPAGSERWWRALALGSAVWLSVLPYEHPYDATLLVPCLLIIAAGGLGPSQALNVAAILAMVALPELDLMGFRPNLTFSYTVIPEVLAAAALAALLAGRSTRAARAAPARPASPAPRSAASTTGPGPA